MNNLFGTYGEHLSQRTAVCGLHQQDRCDKLLSNNDLAVLGGFAFLFIHYSAGQLSIHFEGAMERLMRVS